LQARAFDDLAADYDATFSDSALGRTLRSLVWSRLEQLFRPPQRVLELGCGTGVDALALARRGVEVVAIDASPGMIQIARQKAAPPGRVAFHCLPMERLSGAFEGQLFDGVLSNFGAVNCVPDLRTLVSDVALCLRPGAHLVWVVMGRHVPWEWAWFLSRGEWSKAWRRLAEGGVSWRGLTIRYPTPGEVAGLLRPHFSIDRIAPLGVALPPSYAGEWLARRPRLSKVLTDLEYRAQSRSALARVADHYIVEATRLDAGARA
jgi:SAM-dependent methyltransferase